MMKFPVSMLLKVRIDNLGVYGVYHMLANIHYDIPHPWKYTYVCLYYDIMRYTGAEVLGLPHVWKYTYLTLSCAKRFIHGHALLAVNPQA